VRSVVRTIHHVDAFSNRMLEECQRASIRRRPPALRLGFWAERLRAEFDVDAEVCPTGRLGALANCRTGARGGERFGWARGRRC